MPQAARNNGTPLSPAAAQCFFSVCLTANTFGSGSTLFCKWESLPHRSRRLLQVSGNYFPNCCQLKQKCICHFLSNPTSGIKLNKQMLVTDPHGQKKGPSSSAVVFVIAGPWRQTLGDTQRTLSLTSSEQCYFLGFRVKVKKSSIFVWFFLHTCQFPLVGIWTSHQPPGYSGRNLNSGQNDKIWNFSRKLPIFATHGLVI